MTVNFINCLMFLITYLCIYSIVNRICECFEHCSLAKNSGQLYEKVAKKVGSDKKDS